MKDTLRVSHSLLFLLLGGAALAPAKPLEYVCYSPFRDGQAPGGAEPTEAQVAEDFRILAPLAKGVRTYGSRGILAKVPALARDAGLEVHVGAWIGTDTAANRAEVDALIALAKSGNPAIRGLIVGNEVLLRGDVTKARLIEYLRKVRAANTGIPVTTADIYQNLVAHAADLEPVCDYALCHVHPYWESVAAGAGAARVLDGWKQVRAKYPGKPVIVGETGFPSAGQANGGGVPGESEQARFVEDVALLAAREGFSFMLFSAFDEAWKTGEPNAVGPHWGIWKADRSEKPAVARLRALPAAVLPRERIPSQGAAAEAPAEARSGVDAMGREPAPGKQRWPAAWIFRLPEVSQPSRR